MGHARYSQVVSYELTDNTKTGRYSMEGQPHAPTPAVKTFEDLRAWKLAFQVAVQVYKVTRSFPEEERYGLTSQLRRAASSISANIAEGFGRRAPREYLQFLFFARGSLAETQSHLRLAQAICSLGEDEFRNLDNLCVETRKTLNGLIRYIHNRMDLQRVSKVSENLVDYMLSPSD